MSNTVINQMNDDDDDLPIMNVTRMGSNGNIIRSSESPSILDTISDVTQIISFNSSEEVTKRQLSADQTSAKIREIENKGKTDRARIEKKSEAVKLAISKTDINNCDGSELQMKLDFLLKTMKEIQ